MIEVKDDRDLRMKLDSCLDKLYKIDGVGVLSCAGGSLEDQGGSQLGSCLGNTLNDLHVVDVESSDSIAAVIGLFEHLS